MRPANLGHQVTAIVRTLLKEEGVISVELAIITFLLKTLRDVKVCVYL